MFQSLLAIDVHATNTPQTKSILLINRYRLSMLNEAHKFQNSTHINTPEHLV